MTHSIATQLVGKPCRGSKLPIKCSFAALVCVVDRFLIVILILAIVLSVLCELTGAIWAWRLWWGCSALGLVGAILRYALASGDRSRRHGLMAFGIILTLSFGVMTSLHTSSFYDPNTQRLVTAGARFGWLPAGVDFRAGIQAWGTAASASALAWLVSVAAASGRFGKPLIFIVLGTGFALCVAEVLNGVLSKPLVMQPSHPESVFGWFRTHGSAGSVLLVSALVGVGVVGWYWRDGRHAIGRAVAVSVVVLMVWACLLFVNISEAAAGIAILMLVSWLLVWPLFGVNTQGHSPKIGRRIGFSMTCIPLFVIALPVALVMFWPGLIGATGLGGRLYMWRSALGIAQDAGWWGFGPGSFKLLLPTSEHLDPGLYRRWIVTHHVPGDPVSHWSHAYNDYLQSLIEWGWFATLFWLSLFGFAWVRLIVLARRSMPIDRYQAWLLLGLVAALGGLLLHALLDAPFQSTPVCVLAAILVGLGWGLPGRSTVSVSECFGSNVVAASR